MCNLPCKRIASQLVDVVLALYVNNVQILILISRPTRGVNMLASHVVVRGLFFVRQVEERGNLDRRKKIFEMGFWGITNNIVMSHLS